jgi:hypothetical protein
MCPENQLCLVLLTVVLSPVGLFNSFTVAQNVVQERMSAVILCTDISVLANDRRGEYARS